MKKPQTMEAQKAVFRRDQEGYPVAARLNRYLKLATAYKDKANESEALTIKLLENYIGLCRAALEQSDIDHFAQSFEWVIRYAVELNLPQRDKIKQRNRGAKGGKAGKGKRGYFATMLTDICNEISSTKNKDVLQYWRRYDDRDGYMFAPEDSAWEVYELWADWRGSTAPGWNSKDMRHSSADGSHSDRLLAPSRKDNEFEYYYLDKSRGLDEAKETPASLEHIRSALYKIRKRNKETQ